MTFPRFNFELATSEAEIRAYFKLRQAIFCQEQGLFNGHDQDDLDAVSYPIIALERDVIAGQGVVGVVRIYETQPRLWYGGRLGVHPRYRRVGRIGQGLIHKAVTTAHSWGCDRFLATVQLQNVRFFRRLHWQSVEEISLCNRPHHLMVADLAHYPPSGIGRPMPPLRSRQVS